MLQCLIISLNLTNLIQVSESNCFHICTVVLKLGLQYCPRNQVYYYVDKQQQGLNKIVYTNICQLRIMKSMLMLYLLLVHSFSVKSIRQHLNRGDTKNPCSFITNIVVRWLGDRQNSQIYHARFPANLLNVLVLTSRLSLTVPKYVRD